MSRIRASGIAIVVSLLMIAFDVSAAFAGTLEDAVAQVERRELELADKRIELDRREASYAAQLEHIAALKRGDGGLVDELVLQDALRDARRSADELNALSAELRALEAALRNDRLEAIGACDGRIGELEAKLVSSRSAQEQGELVLALELAQQQREGFRQAVGELVVGSEPDLSSMQADDPDELRAALAELRDYETEVSRQLEELDDRIASLEQRRRLVAYAEGAADEQRLFAEDARGTRIAASDGRGSSTSANTDGNGVQPPSEVPEATEGKTPIPSELPIGEADSDGAYGGTDPNAGWNGDDGRFDEGTITPIDPPELTEAVTPPSSTFEPGTVVVRREADVAVVVGGAKTSAAAGDELRQLKRSRASLQDAIQQSAQQRAELVARLRELGIAVD